MITRSQYLMNRLLDEAIKPNALAISEITVAGHFVVVGWEMSDAKVRDALRKHGWRPKRIAFPMTESLRAALSQADPVTRRWLATPPENDRAKIFLYAHSGTLLVNYDPDKGFWIEPGSLDHERAEVN